MKYCILLLIVTSLYASPYKLITFPDTLSYDAKKQECLTIKASLKQKVARGKMSYEEVGKVFEEILVTKLIPYWYGVTWEFYGHTNTPDTGTIACGYFVSTTLKHLGFNLNRYRFAQQAALNEIKSLVSSRDKIMRFTQNKNLEGQLQKKLPEGLYMIGLDYHVGYILRHKEQVYFIHSSYYSPSMVVIEEVGKSSAFWDSNSYYIAPISTDTVLMKKWLEGTRINIVTR